MLNVIEYTRALLAFNTTNPPGDEQACGEFVAQTLSGLGFDVRVYGFGENRLNIVAKYSGANAGLDPLVLTGHLDTVPLGEAAWTQDPFKGEIVDGKLYGRGSSDMKSGVAAMIVAAAEMIGGAGQLERGLVLIFTGGEETGCTGAIHLMEEAHAELGTASAMIVGEPTENQVCMAHKGALYLRASAGGVTAHSSTPELGDNAIYKAARAISSIENYGFNERPHPLLGSPSINVGMMSGGMNINSVPDRAEFTIDIRTNAGKPHVDVLEDLQTYLGDAITLETLTDMPAVSTARDDPFAKMVVGICADVLQGDFKAMDKGLPFFTDASAFHPHFKCPTLILGPGELSTMHQTDEYCLVARIEQAVEIYANIIRVWCKGA
ncbi:MAG: peptidase M20 [Robiginitomaculum sp.]|nr:MAG: peptidase M20 [Robiginitomaculum sp.]